jgi:hypothetical protein
MAWYDEPKLPKMSKAAKKSLAECEEAINAYLRGFEESYVISRIRNDNPNMTEAEAEKRAKAFLERERRSRR